MTYHKRLSEGKWEKLSLIEQMANIGSEVSRAINWKGKSEKDAKISFERALELIDLTIDDPKNLGRLKEIVRVREIFTDWYLGTRLYEVDEND